MTLLPLGKRPVGPYNKATIPIIKPKGTSTVTAFEETRDGLPKAYMPNFYYRAPFGYPRYKDLNYYRQLAASIYVDMCVTAIIDEVCSVEWDIVAEDRAGNEVPGKEKDVERIQEFFYNPNTNKESWEMIVRMMLPDLLELNSGIMVKIFNMFGEMVEICSRDGMAFTKNPDPYGFYTTRADLILMKNILGEGETQTQQMDYPAIQAEMDAVDAQAEGAYFQYGFNTGARPIPFGRREIVWFEKKVRTDNLYGRSSMEILAKTVQTLIYAVESQLEYFNDNSIPPGVLGLEGMSGEDLKAFGQQWVQQQKVQDSLGNWKRANHKLPMVNKMPKFERLGFTNQELELIESQKWWSKLVWGAFGITATELGFTEDAKGAANQIVQTSVAKKRIIYPLLRLIEYHVNTEIIPEFGVEGIRYKYKIFDVDEEVKKWGLYKLQTESDLKTVNEVRNAEGLDELEGGDETGSMRNDRQQAEDRAAFSEEPLQSESNKINNDAADERSAMSAQKKSYLKFKYAKRTGAPGNYIYWYKDPKTGKLRAGDKPKENKKLSQEEVENFKSSDSVLHGNEKYSNDLDSPFEEISEVSELKDRLVKLSEKDGYINLNHGSSKEGVLENYERKKDDLLKGLETYGNGLYLAIDKDYSITKNAKVKYKVPVSTRDLKGLYPTSLFELPQILSAKASMSISPEVFSIRAERLGYSEKQIKKDIKWMEDNKEKIDNLKATENGAMEVFGDSEEYWEEYSFPSSIFEVGMEWKGYTGVIDMQKNITLINPDERTVRSSILSNGSETKAQTTDSPTVLSPNEEMGPSEKKLKKQITDLLKSNKEKVFELLEQQGKPEQLLQIKSIDDLPGIIKKIFEVFSFKKIVDEVISFEFNFGWDKSEKQIDKNIPMNNKALEFLQDHTFDNIKDMTEEISNDLKAELSRGIINGEGIAKLKKRVTKVFDVGNNRAEMISRTEVNRAENNGKLLAMKNSGMEMKKQWVAANDDRTSELCKHLDGKTVDLDDNFSYGDWSGQSPPAHVNCRSTMIFLEVEEE